MIMHWVLFFNSNNEQAIQIKSTPEVVGKIDAIKKILADLASANEKKANYDAAINSADELFKASNWEASIAKYKEAQTIDNHSESYIQVKPILKNYKFST